MINRHLNRREFGKVAGASMASVALASTASSGGKEFEAPAPVYQGPSLRSVAMPLGGIGAGHYCIAGDGSLRQWQIFNIPNHLAFLPGTFFAIRVNRDNFTTGRLLQTKSYYGEPDFVPAPEINDHEVPRELEAMMESFPGVEDVEFRGEYPVAHLRYIDNSLPVAIQCTVMTPMVPLDTEFSGLPAAIYRFTFQPTRSRYPIKVALLASMQNAVGYDGISQIKGVENHGYGGNLNTAVRFDDLHGIHMSNTWLKEDAPGNGSMLLGTRPLANSKVETYTGWGDSERFLGDFFRIDHRLGGYNAGTSTRGYTWNAGLVQHFTLTGEEVQTITFYHTWHMPNFYVNWRRRNPGGPKDKSRFWVGKAYTAHYQDALEVARHVVEHEELLWKETQTYRDAFYRSTLPTSLISRVGSQTSIIRSPTTFWDDHGRFFGFEGCNGASANWISMVGGCCPLNCTHVWNYEQSLAYLYPSLERSMRETEFLVQQSPEGFIQHRVPLPLYLPRHWDDPQGGPRGPALDGMLSIVLRTYREVRQMRDTRWLEIVWPHVRSLIEHCISKFDPSQKGVIEGEQPNTYDISIYGPNTFIGSLYLAALRAAEEMARRCGDAARAERYREIFNRGRNEYDRLCWNGDYFVQVVRTTGEAENAYGTGCHSDQLIGQWWAHMLDLGYVLPAEHVATAVGSIFRYNFLSDFSNFHHSQRVFADRKDAGLLMATWPGGGRPEKPTRYCDEVWTGIEYEVAALCLYEGLTREAEDILNSINRRYDGTRRNPWNEVECGDHYARAMSSYGVLLAASGFHYDGPRASLTFGPRLAAEDFRAFYAAGTGWGVFTQRRMNGELKGDILVSGGDVEIQTLLLKHSGEPNPRVTTFLDSRPLAPAVKQSGAYLSLRFGRRLAITQGNRLSFSIG